MVRVQISFDAKTKDYNWKITEDSYSSYFNIETPQFNTLYIRNIPYNDDQDECKQFETCEKLIIKTRQDDPEFATDNVHINLSEHFFKKSRRSLPDLNYFSQIYHPIERKFIKCDHENLEAVFRGIHIDILNYVLQYDEQQRKQRLTEHNSMYDVAKILKEESVNFNMVDSPSKKRKQDDVG